ncbi:hypothetical protein [Thiohalocapsa marina]|nr:hypothetical protein [Thiohalocapsa marina]
MLAGIAVAALLIGSVSTAAVVTQEPQSQDENRTPVVEVQKVESVNPFIE